MNILQKEFFEEKLLHYVLYAIILWSIMVIIHTPNMVLEKSLLADTNVHIVVINRKKPEVFGRI
jgi:hypothetical protein